MDRAYFFGYDRFLFDDALAAEGSHADIARALAFEHNCADSMACCEFDRIEFSRFDDLFFHYAASLASRSSYVDV